ncbi:hypothetical protein ACQP1G_16685 [Nocardia sp. CA-107356]|uniref:hypothetical protein n=1 Tax=Nocardia sp. CA-107356 TaxID=3239972 RepID=UPI003D912CFA
MTMIITEDVLLLLHSSGSLLGSEDTNAAAEYIYAQFAEPPGGKRFLYDRPTRIRSTARLLDFLIRRVGMRPFDADQVDAIFRAIGTSHARAGLPIELLDEGTESSLAA